MTRPIRFGDFVFEDNGVEVGTNFGSVKPQTEALPGMDGGYDNFGDGPAPKEIGNLRFNLILKADTHAEMQTKRDALLRLAAMKRKRLFVEPTDTTRPVRWNLARVNDIQLSENFRNRPWQTQAATLNFQLSDPRWYSKEDMWYLDDGLLLDSGLTFQGPTPVNVNDGDTLTITNEGTAPTKPVITVKGGASVAWYIGDAYVVGQEGLYVGGYVSGAVQGFGMRQIGDDGQVLNEWFWLGTVAVGERLVIDCGACTVRHESIAGDANGYPDFYITKGFAFPSLEPGDNHFEIFGTFTGDVEVSVEFFDAWS